MDCALCGEPTDPGAELCRSCSAVPLSLPAARSAAVPGDLAAMGETIVAEPARAVGPGDRLGTRYEIVRLLGKGGMGAVFLAHDAELGRDVALKVIAPHLASEPSVLVRFKREIQLSSAVTHPNVLRVYDLGEADGVKFLTMQFIDGETLADVMRRRGAMPVDEALALFLQIAAGLAAAHENGVLHRDLKPQNVMVDRAGRAYVTDFGLATSAAVSTMTRAGALIGTPQYMSPEQVRGEHVDARSDLFSLGVILYEMLAGAAPYAGDTAFEIMMARTRGLPRPARELNPAIPQHVQGVLDRCLSVDPAQRYGSAAELLAQLDARSARPARRVNRRALKAGAAAAVIAVLGVAAALAARAVVSSRGTAAPVAVAPRAVTPQAVLVADFANSTGDRIFDGTLEPAVGLALEGASFITAYNRASAERAADSLKLEGAGLTESRARLVAQREGIRVVASGAIAPASSGFRLSMRAVDAFTGATLVDAAEEVAAKEQVLAAATKLSARLRATLGDATPEALQLQQGETFSASSLEAAHAYSSGVDLFNKQTRYDEARRQLLEAVRLDPGLGRAYVGLAVLEQNLGHRAEAEKHLKEAMARIDRMSDREKHRTRGFYYLFYRDTDRGIEAYEALVKQFPADAAGLANLAVGYQLKRNFKRALEESRRAMAIYPRDLVTRNNLGLFAMYAGDAEQAIAEQRKVLEMNPGFVNGWVGLALAQELAGNTADAARTWSDLRRVDSGASIAVEGLVDLALYEGRISDALALLAKAPESDLAANEPEAAARKLEMLAAIHLQRGNVPAAKSAATRALEHTHQEYTRFALGMLLARAGEEKRALALADELDRRLAAEPRMYAALIRGAAEQRRGNHAAAIDLIKGAGQRVDSWLVHVELARAYAAAGAFAEAHDELEQCVRRQGEATDVYLDTIPTYRLYPEVRYAMARAYEGLGSAAAADAYRSFLSVKKGDEELLVRDARVRLARLDAAASARR